jgi:hypothetical protein
MMYGYGYGGPAMWGMGVGGLFCLLFFGLVVAALVKYLFFSHR